MKSNERRLPRLHRRVMVFLVVCGLYVGTYVVLSRNGYREADKYNVRGFFFVIPSSPVMKFANDSCKIIFYPLIKLEQMLGTGRTPAWDPIEKLSEASPRRMNFTENQENREGF